MAIPKTPNAIKIVINNPESSEVLEPRDGLLEAERFSSIRVGFSPE